MKIRNDFVTNSSSSSFTLSIEIGSEYDCELKFQGHGGAEFGRTDYFFNEAVMTVSPKQLAQATSVDELIELLRNGVVDGIFSNNRRVFDTLERTYINELYGYDLEDDEYEEEIGSYEEPTFLDKIRNTIRSMDQIEYIKVNGDEKGYYDEAYYREYRYDARKDQYTLYQIGDSFESNGSSNGDLEFHDTDDCQIVQSSSFSLPHGSFTLSIRIALDNNLEIRFVGHGCSPINGRRREDYFDGCPVMTVSPKQLAQAKTVEEFIEMLQGAVVDDCNGQKRQIFAESHPLMNPSNMQVYDAYDFIERIKETVQTMNQIEYIEVASNDTATWDEQIFNYDLKTDEYLVYQQVDTAEDKISNGALVFSDEDQCEEVDWGELPKNRFNTESDGILLQIRISTESRGSVYFRGYAGDEKNGVVDYFAGDIVMTVSPKQLAKAESVEEMITLLQNGVIDEKDGRKIFEQSLILESDVYPGKLFDAYDFVRDIRSHVKTMAQIEEIEVGIYRKKYIKEMYYGVAYDEYTCYETGKPIKKMATIGLQFNDFDECTKN